jgi:isoquinoline 1-oxidoreductase subunit alpha
VRCLLDSIGESAIEAIDQTQQGAAFQKAWPELEIVQCRYCQSGQIKSAAALLKDTPKPTNEDIDAIMPGNAADHNFSVKMRRMVHRSV